MKEVTKKIVPNNDQIQQLFLATGLPEPISIKVITSGGDSASFEIITPSGEFILRASGKRNNYDVEQKVLELVRGRGMLAPEVIAQDITQKKYPFSYSLLGKTLGVNLLEVDRQLWPEILKGVGRQLSYMHAIRLDGFGILDPQIFRKNGTLVGTYNSLVEALETTLFPLVETIRQKIEKEKREDFANSRLPSKRRDQIGEILVRMDEVRIRIEKSKTDFRGVGDGRLIHHDIHFEHILVHDGKLSGLIDFNHAAVGDPLFDIAYFSVMPNGELYEHLLEGSGVQFDAERFHLYRLLISIGKIHTRYIENDYLHEYPEVLDYALEELNR